MNPDSDHRGSNHVFLNIYINKEEIEWKIELTKNNKPLLVFTQTLRKVLNSTGQNIDLVTLLASRHLDFTKSAITM